MDGNVTENEVMNEITGKVAKIPRIDNTLTKEGYAADSKKTGDELAERVKKTDIADNLTTDDATKPLSAKQGVEIKRQLDSINLSQAGTVGYNNGTSGLSATNMQSAIDELASNTTTMNDTIENHATTLDNLDDNYIPTNGGGLVNGSVKVRNADNGYGEVSKNNSSEADYGTQLLDVRKDGKSAKVSVSAATGLLTYTDVDSNIRGIHHEGNKPFGEYVGNGSATPRAVATKGIGRMLLLYCSTRQAYVTPKGADVIDLTTGERSWIDSSKINFLSGNLNISTANEAANKANETYYYQVL